MLVAFLCNELVQPAGAGWGRDSLLPTAFSVVVLMALMFLLERGRGWARWLLLVLTAWNLLQLSLAWSTLPPGILKYGPNIVYAIRSVAADVCLLAATILVFGPGRAWFRRKES